MRRAVLLVLASALTLTIAGDAVHVHAATCTPSEKGKCYACKNCRYCRHCSKNGGTCSVCR